MVLVTHLRQVGEAGVGSVSEDWQGDDAVYLGERIRYDLDDRALMGLRRFAALAHRQQLIPSADVTLLQPTIRELPRLEGVGALLDKVLDGGTLTEDEAEGLAINASLADLGAAASLLRASDQSDDAVHWCLGWRLEDASLLDEAIEAGAVEIHLSSQTPPDLAAVWVQKWPDVRFVAPWSAVPAEVNAWIQTGVWGLGDDPVGLGADVLRAAHSGAGDAFIALEAMAIARQGGLAVTGVLRVGQGESEMDHIQWIQALALLHQGFGLAGIRVEAALCAGTVSDSECRLTCDDGFIGSAARVACVDGTWEKQTCTLDEESESYTQYIIIPIGAVITLVVVFVVARKQDLAMAAVMGMMKDTVILFGSITLEIMVSSGCVCACLFCFL